VGAQTHILVLSVPLKRLFICCFSLELQSWLNSFFLRILP
jgi:hypothetical protein